MIISIAISTKVKNTVKYVQADLAATKRNLTPATGVKFRLVTVSSACTY